MCDINYFDANLLVKAYRTVCAGLSHSYVGSGSRCPGRGSGSGPF